METLESFTAYEEEAVPGGKTAWMRRVMSRKCSKQIRNDFSKEPIVIRGRLSGLVPSSLWGTQALASGLHRETANAGHVF